METTQNITLSIPKNVLRKAKILAVRKNISLSGLLTQTLSDLAQNLRHVVAQFKLPQTR